MAGDRWDIATGYAPPAVDDLDRDGFATSIVGGAATRSDAQAEVHAVQVPAADTDRLSEQAALRRRTLADVARDLRVSGDRVVVGIGGRHVTGVVTHAAGDLATLETTAGALHANLRRVDFVRVAEAGATDGIERSHGPSSFKARLFELELAGTRVSVGIDGEQEELGARIVAVGVDHLVLDRGEDGEWVVPLVGVVYVAVPLEDAEVTSG